MTLAVLGAIFFWGIALLPPIVIVFNQFSTVKLLGDNRTYKTVWLSAALSLFLLPALSGLVFRIGQEMETTPGVRWGCYFESVILGELLLTAMFYGILTILLVIGLVRSQFLGYARKLNLLLSYFILMIAPIATLAMTMFFIRLFSGHSLSGSCL